MRAGQLDRRIRILELVETRDATFGSVIQEWTTRAEAWAQVQDMIPSRAERVAEGISLARRPCRVRMRWRDDISAANRIEVDGRVLRIVGGPAELGRREGIELLAEELTSEGIDA